MRLCAIEVSHWACIGHLKLADLPDGMVVLHGPNGIGKSSLVQALRSCLFDHEHSSTNRILQEAVNWHKPAPPRVAIEFEQGGRRYRLAKVFAKTKEGSASLEEQSGAGWTMLAKGKEVTGRVRALLGTTGSEAGLYQLLWLRQGEVRLPEKVDPQLEQAVEDVLGVLITSRDVAFKQQLDKACERWFTPTMAEKKNSRWTMLAQELAAARENLKEIEGRFAALEEDLRRWEDARQRQPLLAQELKAAEAELEQAQQAATLVRERRHASELAGKEQEQAEQRRQTAQVQLDKWLGVQQQTATAREDQAVCQGELKAAQERRRQAKEEEDEANRLRQAALAAIEQHQQGGKELEQRQQLVHLGQRVDDLRRQLDDGQRLAGRCLDLEKQLAGPAAPSEEELKQLRANREEMHKLQARLEAEAIRLTFRADVPMEVDVAVDQQPATRQVLTDQEEGAWQLRQQGRLEIAGVGVVKVARGEEKSDLEQAARRLGELTEDYQRRLRQYQVGVDDADALHILAERQIVRGRLGKELQEARQSLEKLAPQGLEALAAQLPGLEQGCRAVLEAHPSWETWSPNQADVDRWKQAHQSQAAALQTAVQQANQAQERAGKALRDAQKTFDDLDRRGIELKANLDGLIRQLSDLGEESELRRRLQEAQAAVSAAQAKTQASALTEDDRLSDERVRSAQQACQLRQERLQKNEGDLRELQGRLAGSEGLHLQRIEAEQRVHELGGDYAREDLLMRAHRHVREAFERIRQEQVRRTVGPVSARVLAWARQIGIQDYADLDFGDEVLPGQLLLGKGTAEAGAIELQRESYGRMEVLSLLIRLALGGMLAGSDGAVAIFDDPLAHADAANHRRFLEVLRSAAVGDPASQPPAGPLQIIVLTCHPDRFDYLQGARQVDLRGCMT